MFETNFSVIMSIKKTKIGLFKGTFLFINVYDKLFGNAMF